MSIILFCYFNKGWTKSQGASFKSVSYLATKTWYGLLSSHLWNVLMGSLYGRNIFILFNFCSHSFEPINRFEFWRNLLKMTESQKLFSVSNDLSKNEQTPVHQLILCKQKSWLRMLFIFWRWDEIKNIFWDLSIFNSNELAVWENESVPFTMNQSPAKVRTKVPAKHHHPSLEQYIFFVGM